MILATILFYAIGALILLICSFIPAVDTFSDFYRQIYYRGTDVMDTSKLPFGTLLYYVLMNMLGHAYVNTSNLNLKRKSFIKTNSTDAADFVCCGALAPVFFFISSISVLKFEAQRSEDPNTFAQCFVFNLFCWQTAFFIGLQFTHLDCGPMQHFVLKAEAIRKWGFVHWALIVVLLLLGVFLTGYFIWVYHEAGCLLAYVLWGCLIGIGFAAVTWALRKTHYVHMHHYTAGMLIIALIGYPSVIAALV